MQVVVLVDAAPGFEEAVQSALRRVAGVTRVARLKEGNFDMACLIEVEDEGSLQRILANQVRTVSGVRGMQRVPDPGPGLLQRLEESS